MPNHNLQSAMDITLNRLRLPLPLYLVALYLRKRRHHPLTLNTGRPVIEQAPVLLQFKEDMASIHPMRKSQIQTLNFW